MMSSIRRGKKTKVTNVAGRFSLALLLVLWSCFTSTLLAKQVSAYDSCLSESKSESKVAACRKAIEEHGAWRNLYIELGEALDQLKRFKGAVTAYEQALKHYPGDRLLSGKLAIAKSNLHEQEWLKQRISKPQSSPRPASNSASSVQTKLDQIRCKRLSGVSAVNACNAVLKVAPDDPSILQSKGAALLKLGRLSEAKKTYERMLRINPSNTLAEQKLLEIDKKKGEIAHKQSSKKEMAVAERLTAEKEAKTKLAREKADKEQLARQKAAEEKRAREKAAEAKLARKKAEKAKLAREKIAAEKLAREKTANEQLARQKAAEEKRAREKAAEAKLARKKAEKAKLAREKLAAEKLARERAAKEQLARQKAAEEKRAREKAAEAKLARKKAEKAKLARETLAAEKLAREKAAKEQLARQKAAEEKMTREKAAAEAKLARKKTEKAKLAREKIAAEKLAREKASKEKLTNKNAIVLDEKNDKRPPGPGSPVIVNPKLSGDNQEFVSQLRLLVSLRAQGLIDEEEFAKRKALLLDAKFRVGEKTVISAKDDKPSFLKDKPSFIDDLNFGKYYALVIGNNGYKHLPQLDTAMGDAKAISKLLKEEYDFEVNLLTDATRYDILKSLGQFRRRLTENDNFLIYYAGHGILDKRAERGYWLPTDAEQSFKANWISTTEISDSLKALEPKHIMVVADSCYSGTLVRGSGLTTNELDNKKSLIKRLLSKKSRTVLTSGGLEPVIDSGGDGHSVFAQAFLDVLNENENVLEGQRLFTVLRRKVVLNADQTPEYSDIRRAGHNGGDFIFVRK